MSLTHYSYPSIPQFRVLVDDLKHSARYIGKDSEGKPRYDENKPLPKIKLEGSVKIHGANCSVVLDKEGNFYCQSREIVLNEKESCNGFYQFTMAREKIFRTMLDSFLRGTADKVKAVVIYGEWAGPGIQRKVGISKINSPVFFIFDVRLIDDTYEHGNTGFIDYQEDLPLLTQPHARILPIQFFGLYEVELDVLNPSQIQPQLIEITSAVEKRCPAAAYFGIEGTGEGVVWTVRYNGRKYRMKVKGAKHSNTKVKQLAAPDMEKINSIDEFISYAFTENRMQQGIDWMRQNNHDLTIQNVGTFIRWVFQDVIKEEGDVLAKNGLSTKDISFKGNYVIRQFYMQQLGH